ncbi:hypothetical protein [Azospirillum sp. B4]|uniref:hypothetical protein n=1 Tax=Azospirillum sp. B4 TaxID=95605 RepID=UPI0011DD13E2|nr:hypothetical protein [Azospirillum sp. B4]
MTTTLRAALLACGLSTREAAEFLNVRQDTINKAINGKERTPDGWLYELRALNLRQRRAAQHALDQVAVLTKEQGAPVAVDYGVPVDDTEARHLGWPCIGAANAVASMVWEGLPEGVKMRVAPRGSTPATAAAADAHQK